jgi:nucleoside-diphosphate-sugar epimerase
VKILITGASGFIGQALAARVLALDGIAADGPRLTQLTLSDMNFDAPPSDPRVQHATGDLADPQVLAKALESAPDCVFHLAAIPGGAAEANYDLSKRVNIDAPIRLVDALRNKPNKPRLVMSSSIAVFGSPLPAVVDDDTAPQPALSYGAQKLLMEIYLSDLSRRGEIDARLVRLPGIVARPRMAGGHISAYMSNVFHAIAAGEKFTCPVSKTAVSWFMSASCVVENLLHAARIEPQALRDKRVWTLPALVVNMRDLVAAIGEATGRDAAALVGYEPNEAIEPQFGRYPPLRTPAAEALGFRHDGDAKTLVRRALQHAGLIANETQKGSQKSA